MSSNRTEGKAARWFSLPEGSARSHIPKLQEWEGDAALDACETQSALPPAAGHQCLWMGEWALFRKRKDRGRHLLFRFPADYPVVSKVCQELPLAGRLLPKPKGNTSHPAKAQTLSERNRCNGGQRGAERYLGERKEELVKLLSPLHKLSANKSASFPSP